MNRWKKKETNCLRYQNFVTFRVSSLWVNFWLRGIGVFSHNVFFGILRASVMSMSLKESTIISDIFWDPVSKFDVDISLVNGNINEVVQIWTRTYFSSWLVLIWLFLNEDCFPVLSPGILLNLHMNRPTIMSCNKLTPWRKNRYHVLCSIILFL